MTAAPRPVLAAIAVLVEDQRVLLVRRRNPPDAGLWGFPGGKVEFGETAAAAAERELAEETGVTGEAGRLLTLVDVIGGTDPGRHHYVLAAFLCRRLGGTPLAAADVSEAAWHPTAEILEGALPTSERVGELVTMAVEKPDATPPARSA